MKGCKENPGSLSENEEKTNRNAGYHRELQLIEIREMGSISSRMTMLRCSFKQITILLCVFNVLVILLLLQSLLTPLFERHASYQSHRSPEQLKYIKDAEEIRRAMEPVDLIKRVKQIQLESESGVQSQSEKEILRQKQATELSKRLTDLRSSSDQKALEEWRKRKIERAKKREPISIGTNA